MRRTPKNSLVQRSTSIHLTIYCYETAYTVGYATIASDTDETLVKHTFKVDEEDANKEQILYFNSAINKYC